MGMFYAAALVIGCLGTGNMFQSNQAYSQMVVVTGGSEGFIGANPMIFGFILAAIVGAVVIGALSL